MIAENSSTETRMNETLVTDVEFNVDGETIEKTIAYNTGELIEDLAKTVLKLQEKVEKLEKERDEGKSVASEAVLDKWDNEEDEHWNEY